MKKRNPIFVLGFPYALYIIGYTIFYGMGFASGSAEGNASLSGKLLIAVIIALCLFLAAGIYTLYWQISTARVLRKATGIDIPHAILLFIPIASLWWQWRYGVAAESYTHNKVQAVLAFILLMLLGSIGMGILQDYYNKAVPAGQPIEPSTQAPVAGQVVAQAPPTNPMPPADPNTHTNP